MISMECFSFPPSSNYLDTFNPFFFSVLWLWGEDKYFPRIFSEKVNLFREKLPSSQTIRSALIILHSKALQTSALYIIHTT